MRTNWCIWQTSCYLGLHWPVLLNFPISNKGHERAANITLNLVSWTWKELQLTLKQINMVQSTFYTLACVIGFRWKIIPMHTTLHAQKSKARLGYSSSGYGFNKRSFKVIFLSKQFSAFSNIQHVYHWGIRLETARLKKITWMCLHFETTYHHATFEHISAL